MIFVDFEIHYHYGAACYGMAKIDLRNERDISMEKNMGIRAGSNETCFRETVEPNKSRPKSLIEFEKFYRPFLAIFIPCFLYAFLRYTINHGEPVQDLPFYLSNKVLGVSSVIMIGIAYLLAPVAKIWPKFRVYLGHRKYLGVGGFLVGTGHGIMSSLLMTTSNYKVFYDLDTGRLNWQGSLSMFFGTIALVHFGLIAVISVPSIMRDMNPRQWKLLQRGGIVALWTTFLHIAAFGYGSWFNLEKWYGGMPPFSLVGASSIIVLLSLRYALSAFGKRRKARRKEYVVASPLPV